MQRTAYRASVRVFSRYGRRERASPPQDPRAERISSVFLSGEAEQLRRGERRFKDRLFGFENGHIAFFRARKGLVVDRHVGDLTLNVAVASGLKNAKEVLESVKRGEKNYQFIEIMKKPKRA